MKDYDDSCIIVTESAVGECPSHFGNPVYESGGSDTGTLSMDDIGSVEEAGIPLSTELHISSSNNNNEILQLPCRVENTNNANNNLTVRENDRKEEEEEEDMHMIRYISGQGESSSMRLPPPEQMRSGEISVAGPSIIPGVDLNRITRHRIIDMISPREPDPESITRVSFRRGTFF